MNFRKIAISGAVVVGTSIAMLSAPVQAAENFIPRGHAYGPGQDYLPPLNSKRDRINAQADIREAEIQRVNRETRIMFEQMRQQFDLDLTRPGRPYSPY
ncbi:MAG: hypothetical protein ACR2PM_09990 [Hyphomicrobiales bacterium]